MDKPVIDCRSSEGIVIGLIDGIIAICRTLKSMDLSHSEIREALKDLKSDEDVSYILSQS